MELNSWLAFLGIQGTVFLGFAILIVQVRNSFKEMDKRFEEMRKLSTAVAGVSRERRPLWPV